jgi:hypothetical protein
MTRTLFILCKKCCAEWHYFTLKAFRHCLLHSLTRLHCIVKWHTTVIQLQESTHNVAFCAMTLCEHQCSGKTSCLNVQAWSVKRGREAKVDPLHTTKIYRGNKGTAPLFLKLGTRWSQVVNFMPWLLYCWGKNTSTHWVGGWVGCRASLNIRENRKISWPWQDSNPISSSPRLSQHCSKWRMFFQSSGNHLSDDSVTPVKTLNHT